MCRSILPYNAVSMDRCHRKEESTYQNVSNVNGGGRLQTLALITTPLILALALLVAAFVVLGGHGWSWLAGWSICPSEDVQ